MLGRPLLSWILDAVRAAGLPEPILVTGYRAEAFEQFGLETVHNPDWNKENMVGSLLKARLHLCSERTIISYTDILYSAADLRRLSSASGQVTIAYDPQWHNLWSRRFDDPLLDAETFDIDDDNRVIEIGGRPTTSAQVKGQYIGLTALSDTGWRKIEAVLGTLGAETIAALDMTSLLQRCIHQHGVVVHGMPIRSGWCEVDVPSDIAVAESVLRDLLGSPGPD